MVDKDFYLTVDRSSTAEFKDRGSKFIAYAFPVANTDVFKKELQRLKKEHPKAVHHCFAYRIGTDGNTFRVSDDGEPSGTAGRPILGQIDSKQLVNVGIIVVRYFGGTLLGVPGLIQAYKTAASLALQVIPVIQKPVVARYHLEFNHPQVNEVMVLLKQYNCVLLTREMQLFCSFIVDIPKNRLSELLYKLGELENVRVEQYPQ